MKKLTFFFFSLAYLIIIPLFSEAIAVYEIERFSSDIKIEKDKKIQVTENITVIFKTEHHGIYRVIPVVYTHNGRTINSRLRILSVESAGEKVPYETKRRNQSVEVKIGDPNKYVTGYKIYSITYEVVGILQKYDGHHELFWNVTGHEWDQELPNAILNISSPYADIQKVECFVGLVGSRESNCYVEQGRTETTYYAGQSVGYGKDFTIVARFSEGAQFIEPTMLQRVYTTMKDNWGYFVSPLSLGVILYFWLKKGRDQKHVGDNIYYTKGGAEIVTTGLFERKHVPMVYYPIKSITPSELGTIVDEKVDIKDVVAEIVELARNKFIHLEIVRKKKIFKDEEDYLITKLDADTTNLKEYQNYLLDSLFSSSYVSETENVINKFFDKDPRKLRALIKEAKAGKLIALSSLREKFLSKLNNLKSKVYKDMKELGYFEGNPENTRKSYFAVAILLGVLQLYVLLQFRELTGNIYPLLLGVCFSICGLVISLKMPRRTPKGYALYRQIEGLYYYLKKGKWRYDIHEKKMFFEEMLPLAVSLGIVGKLAKDMEILGVKPPSYASGFVTGNISSSFSSFSSSISNTMLSSSGSRASGSSSWSGGSGFSGGSGGGFGGGGGGGW